VSKYNEYKMAVVPEELIDVPAIGAFESMACGCAYIGIDHPMYKDFGMEPGVHYITYDGTVEGLKDTIKYYQKHNDELESIAINGEALVRNLCSRENVYRIFADAILTL
jgi:spore maturation protein CgeB